MASQKSPSFSAIPMMAFFSSDMDAASAVTSPSLSTSNGTPLLRRFAIQGSPRQMCHHLALVSVCCGCVCCVRVLLAPLQK